MSVAVLSLDGLSDVRAEGRAASGDAAMQALSAHVAARLRAMDIGCRIGEDELAAILPEVEGIDAFRVGERLRASLREDPMLAGAFTLSVGVASFPDQAAGADELAAHARSAMAWARLHDGDRTFLFHREAAAILDAEQQRRAADEESLLATLLALADSVDARHASGGGHSERVGRLAEAMAAELGFPAEHCARVGLAGRLHDLGKAGMRREIVVAEGPLSEGDITELRRHPEIGGRMLGGCALEDLVPWVRHHHERADGDGFPDGLVGDCIPLERASSRRPTGSTDWFTAPRAMRRCRWSARWRVSTTPRAPIWMPGRRGACRRRAPRRARPERRHGGCVTTAAARAAARAGTVTPSLVAAAAERMSAPSIVVQDTLVALEDGRASMRQIASAWGAARARAQVMRLGSSAIHGSAAGTLDQALVRIGTANLRAQLLATSTYSLLAGSLRVYGCRRWP